MDGPSQEVRTVVRNSVNITKTSPLMSKRGLSLKTSLVRSLSGRYQGANNAGNERIQEVRLQIDGKTAVASYAVNMEARHRSISSDIWRMAGHVWRRSRSRLVWPRHSRSSNAVFFSAFTACAMPASAAFDTSRPSASASVISASSRGSSVAFRTLGLMTISIRMTKHSALAGQGKALARALSQ